VASLAAILRSARRGGLLVLLLILPIPFLPQLLTLLVLLRVGATPRLLTRLGLARIAAAPPCRPQ
jgi:hypothetical protein